ncbi:MAG: hypothetical protein JWN76_307 [Chitinophagaceae bacterium]|nr:hypothetical protein [Chitinophagaceae bacterium]
MKNVRFPLLKLALFVFFASVITVACRKNNADSGDKSVSVFLTDDPSLVFDNVYLDIQKVEIKAEDSLELKDEKEHEGDHDAKDEKGDQSGGWINLNIKPGTYDILKFRNGLDTLFATGTFSSLKSIKRARITLGNNNSVVFNGVTFPLVAKKNIVVVKLDESVTQLNGVDQVKIWLDFDAGRSISKRGSSFELDCKIKSFSKEKSGGIEGSVLPADAKAIVMAINGTDTSTAKPENGGEFKIHGLRSGSYKVVAHATANNYRDTTLSNIVVNIKDDTKIPTITLHK